MKGGEKIMKKLMIIGALILALCVGLLVGCGSADMYVFDLSNVFYKGAGFAESINTLNTPQKIGNYMATNFDYEKHPYNTQSPWQTWDSEKADCNDASEFFTYACLVHNIGRNYQYPKGLQIYLTRTDKKGHTLGLYWDGSYWDYTSVFSYRNVNKSTFAQIVQDYDDSVSAGVVDYIVYDFALNVVQDPADYNNKKYAPY